MRITLCGVTLSCRAARQFNVWLLSAAGGLSLIWLSLFLGHPREPPQAHWPSASIPEHLIRTTVPRSPSAEALWRARWLRTLAALAASRRQEALETWDPTLRNDPDCARPAFPPGAGGLDLDPDGLLERAREWALRAAALARTSDEAYQSAECLLLIDHDSGDHAQEAEEAGIMAALQPWNPLSQVVLERTARCNIAVSRRLTRRWSTGS